MKTFLFFIVSIITISAYAQPGTPDKSFGDNGVILDTTYAGFCNALAMQPDGKILTGGNGGFPEKPGSGGLCIARYNSNGSIDESFGDRGKFIVGKIPGAQPQSVRNIVVLPDDKILVCGYFTVGVLFGHPGLLRLFKDGKIDSSFGTNGFVTIYLSEWGDATAGMAVQADGKIIVAGNKYIADLQPGPDFLLRYMPDGTPDASFGENGQVFTYYTSNVRAGALLLQPDEKIVVGDVFGGATQQFQLTRYNNNGTLDKEFGVNGIARINPVSSFLSDLNSLAIQDDGKIIAAGLYDFGPSMALARFNANGSTDSAFGNLGLGYTYFYTPNVYAIGKSVFVLPNKKIILTGFYSKNPAEQVAAVQYNNNGTVDSSFGINGIATGGFAENKNSGYESSGVGLLQPDGKIIVSGSFLQNDDETFKVGLFRFNGDLTQKQILITKIKKWLQHHNGFTWDANSTINSYIVQRSYDGVHFSSITRLNAGNSSNYTYNDASPLSGNNYYRLQTTSTNGTVTYSNVIAVTSNDDAIKISPNPAKNVLQIQGLPSSQKSRITVVDFSGNVKLNTTSNNASFNLNIASLKTGNYLLKIETNGEVVTKKFVKE